MEKERRFGGIFETQKIDVDDISTSIEESVGMKLVMEECGSCNNIFSYECAYTEWCGGFKGQEDWLEKCHSSDFWSWKDGSIHLGDEPNYIIEQEGTDVVVGYISVNRDVRSGSKRLSLGPLKYDDTYHKSTDSI